MPIALSGSALDAAGRIPVTAARPNKAYRADIDGLRAVAVLPVVLFHSGFGVFSGGFVGVDVFFVISGFLITRILLTDMTAGRFSLIRFYERRIRRIFPALFVVLIASFAVGLVVMLPRDLATFGINLSAAAASLSNVLLWMQDDYFDGSSKLKLVLHTWSLSLEEQFYLFWPVLLLVLARLSHRLRLAATVGILAVSLAACIWMTGRDATAAFYLLPYRAWELVLGALLAMGLVPAFRSALAAQLAGTGGLAMILFAVAAFSERTVFPGAAAILPCLGSAMVIHAGMGDHPTIARDVLSRPAAVFIGQISYSFYLWHWPLFVYARYVSIEEPSPAAMIIVSLLALLCATLSWYYVERPFRSGGLLRSRKALFGAAATILVGTAASGALLYVMDGLPQRFSQRVNSLSATADEPNPYAWHCNGGLALRRDCIIGDPARLRYALLGDSHAAALRHAMGRIAEHGAATLYGAASRCPPFLTVAPDTACLARNRRNLAFLASHPQIDTVIIASRWTYYYDGRATALGPAESNNHLPELQDESGRRYGQFSRAARDAEAAGIAAMIHALLAAGKTIVLIYPIPEIGHDVPFTLARLARHGRTVDDFTSPISLYEQRQAGTIALLDGLGQSPRLHRVRPAQILCRDGQCRAADQGRPLYVDSNHLSASGARLMAPAIERAAKAR
ncbi:acyltransferase family protein [Stakelama saccharophila]|uniref:Acyltransferase family protein n=1 Tax=Stakelama saccharophila TaxID=3075605 RepID=A0ABZ0BA41_9SPHN|nr:acyltransferase family protein [Stakelama sp. W311]WNO54223.1 acyltransferase family protein [Stakelama sp. W311]